MLKSFFRKNEVEAGCDEAGRGCLAGPVFAAAVILPKRFKHPLLNDSKLMSEKHRELLRPIIEEKAIAWAVAHVKPLEIDDVNILNASFMAMHRAVDHLEIIPTLLLVDGNRFNAYPNISHECIINGDSKFSSIAAASVLAKTYRDDFMRDLGQKFPVYGWDSNKGYPTKAHRSAIKIHGVTKHHRMTFRLHAEEL